MHASFRSPWAVVLCSLALGLFADQMVLGHWPGLAAALLVLLALAALLALGRAEGRPPARANLWLGAAALLFASFLALRASPALVALDVLAVFGLLVLLASFYRSHALVALPLLSAVSRIIRTCLFSLIEPFQLSQQAYAVAPMRRGHLRRIFPILRGILIAVPLLICFGTLLMSADGTFSAYVSRILSFDLPLDLNMFIWHTFITAMLAWVVAGGLTVALCTPPLEAARLPAEGETQRLNSLTTRLRFLGWVESITVLALLDGLFGAFMLVQAGYLFGGLDTLQRSEMTYADYARRGFFELVVVACLALGELWVFTTVARRSPGRQRALLNGACILMVLLLLGMLCSAFQRMLLYEQAYGFSELRVYTQAFMVWLGALLALFVVSLLRERPRVFVWGGMASALLVLATLNLANPEALIVQANLERYYANGKLDTYYLTELSADAYPALVRALPTLERAVAQQIQDDLAYRRGELELAAADGWASWNLARAQALDVLSHP